MCGSGSDIFLGLLAILFPPLAVWVKRGICSADSIINILLCVLGFVPGLIHAWYIIAKFPEHDEYERVPQDSERGHGNGHNRGDGRVTYVYVQTPQPNAQQQKHQKKSGQQQGVMPANYGTAAANNAGASSSSSNNNNSNNNSNGSGSGEHAPPTYAEAVKGDHKIQSDN